MICPKKQPTTKKPAVHALTLEGPPPPLDMEFKEKDVSVAFSDAGLALGRCFGSKSGYRRANPKSIFIPNANVFCQRYGKVWWGDLDLRCDKPVLERVARRLRCRLYVLREKAGRFEDAEQAHAKVVRNAMWHTGGAVRIPGLRRVLRNSGLSIEQLARLTRIAPSRLSGRQPPEIALEIYQRVMQWDETFSGVAGQLGFKKWGGWWTSAHRKLGDKCPLAVLESGGTLQLAELLGIELAGQCALGLPWFQRPL